nr:hypothetical protein [Tanacetum cinerariifolium]
MLMKHRDAQGKGVFVSQAWRRLFEIRGSLVHELILKFFSTFRFGEAVVDLEMAGALQFYLGGVRHRMCWRQFIALGITFSRGDGDCLIWDSMLRLCHRIIACSIAGRSQALKKVTMTDLFYLKGMDVGSVNIPYLLAKYLRDAPADDEGALADPAPIQIDKEADFQYDFGCKSLKLAHVCFADDLLVMCHGDATSVEVIKNTLDEFSACSCLIPNNSKSNIFFGSLPFAIVKLHVKYIRVPLIDKRLGVK